jgi:hypothetical protein
MSSSSLRVSAVMAGVCALALGAVALSSTHAAVYTGSIVDLPESAPYGYSFGDGTHSVTLGWSVNYTDRSGFFYRNSSTEVAVATGVSSINQITDAGAFTFTTPAAYDVGPVFDVPYTGGLNSFIVLKNSGNNFYGVVRLDDIFRYSTPINYGTYSSYSGLNATWWFQSDGTGNFALVPEPGAMSLLGLGLTVMLARRRAWVG